MVYNDYIMKNDYRIASNDDKNKVLNLDLDSIHDMFSEAPVVVEKSIVYAIVNGIAYPLQEIAEGKEEKEELEKYNV